MYLMNDVNNINIVNASSPANKLTNQTSPIGNMILISYTISDTNVAHSMIFYS